MILLSDKDHPSNMVALQEEEFYRIGLEMRRVDDNKWKWRHGSWIPLLTSRAFGDDFGNEHRRMIFYDRLAGHEIISNGISFDKLKLSNRGEASHSICLQSFHRYIPIIYLCIQEEDTRIVEGEQAISFPETEFIAVTHYQNEQVTLLKKSYNPHAKGFVICDNVPSGGSLEWQLPSDPLPTSPESSIFSAIRKQKRIRKRILPVSAISSEFQAVPSDEEELQGGLALQFLSKSDATESQR